MSRGICLVIYSQPNNVLYFNLRKFRKVLIAHIGANRFYDIMIATLKKNWSDRFYRNIAYNIALSSITIAATTTATVVLI